MAFTNVSLTGQNNGTGDVTALHQEIFSGEVITAFDSASIMKALTYTKSISGAKSASFSILGNMTAVNRGDAGTDLSPEQIKQTKTVIEIERPLAAPIFVDDIDELMTNTVDRMDYAGRQAAALAKAYDTNILKEVIKGARAGALIDSMFGGSTVSLPSTFNTDTTADKITAIADAIFAAKEAMDSKDVPQAGRYLVLKSAEYNLLARNVDFINTQYGGSGAIKDGTVFNVAGFTVIMSNLLPSTDTTGTDAVHGVDASAVKAVAFTKDAVGTLTLQDVKTQTEYSLKAGGTFIVSEYAVGHKYLNPDCAVEIVVGS